ncbi:MAG TPA: hypothetical protein VN903_26105 [Polyangia bacterium]|jgi:hypothetical protein|nr:hypothetical protein [Polyangia bacterium]
MPKQRLLTGVAVAALVAALGCSDLPNTEPSPEDTGRVEFALVVVPTDVQCITITAIGTRVRQQDFIVVPSQTSVLAMNGLPVGQVAFSGQAFNGACGGPAAPMPTYVADPVTAQVNATGVTALTLNMRRNGQASISVDFETGAAMCIPSGGQCTGASATCCTGLACQPDATGSLSCLPPPTCRPLGSICGPGLNAMCCAGLTCALDPTTGAPACQ